MAKVSFFLLLEHFLSWEDDLVDKEASQFAGYGVSFLIFSLVFLAQLENLLDLVSLEPYLGLESFARLRIATEVSLGMLVGHGGSF